MSDTIVDIPGVGQVTFPAGMSDADITATIKTKILPQAAPEKGLLAKGAEAVNTGVNWLGTQVTKGVTGVLGAPAALGEAGKYGATWAGEKLGAPETGAQVGDAFKRQMTFGGIMPSTERMNKAVFGGLGVPEVNAGDNPAFTLTNPYGINAKVNLGKMADSAVQALPSMALGGAALPSMIGGATSEAAGQATAGSPWEIPARLAGGFLGYKGGERIQTPLPANLAPEQARLVEIAREKGVPMTVGQETGRLRGVESAVSRFPTSQGRMAAFGDRQATAINRDLLDQVGVQGERLDPEGMTNVLAQGSRQFNAARNNGPPVQLDRQFYTEAGQAGQNYVALKPLSERAPVVANKLADFLDAPLLATANPHPTLTPAQYQSFRKGINDMIIPGGDGATNNTLQALRNALDNAMERSGTPAQAEAWRAARQNWANLKILTKAASGGSMDSRSAGNITPGSIVSALRQRQGPDQFSTRQGGLNDSARLASYLADSRPNSGTPQTLMMQGALTGGPIGAAYMAGGLPAALAAGGAMALPNFIARAMTGTGSMGAGTLRNYLANQTLADQLGLLNPASAPFALAPGIPGMPRLESRQ